MKQKHTFQRGVAAAVLAGVVLLSGVPALAAAPAAQSAVATQSLWEETPLNGSDTPFFNALRQLLQLLGWKH